MAEEENENSISKISKSNKSSYKTKTLDEEFLFLGDNFYPLNTFCQTKRLLNSFRQACSNSEGKAKFVAQDRTDRPQKLEAKKKINIFAEARKEIELKNKTKKAIVIQRWWRKYLISKNLHNPKSNP